MATERTGSVVFIKSSEESLSETDRSSNLVGGDLGFGLGLKPGAIAAPITIPCIPGDGGDAAAAADELSFRSLHPHPSRLSGDEKMWPRNSMTRRHSAPHVSPENGKIQFSPNESFCDDHCDEGQSKTGFLSGLRARVGLLRTALRNIVFNNGSGDDRQNGLWTSKHQKDLFAQLEAATQEVSVLQSELETARRQLDSKYRAIQILQSQAVMINKEKTRSIQQAKNMKKSLEHEVNSLQFDLSMSNECAMLSQQTWAERFNRVCMENETLVATLRARSEQVRRTQLEKKALMRERDELLAMMDAKERLQYERHKTSTSDAYLHNSMAQQFAMLGACLCRGTKPEPCGCAKAAARLKKENDLLKDEVDELSQNLEAVTMKADSFQTAFDHQLDQNYLLSQQIIQACRDEKDRRNQSNQRRTKSLSENGSPENDHHQTSRSSPCKDGCEEEQIDTNQRDGGNRHVAIQVSEPLPDLISTLAEMLNNKTEALVHQRLVAKMLARKTQHLEKTVEQLNDYRKQRCALAES